MTSFGLYARNYSAAARIRIHQEHHRPAVLVRIWPADGGKSSRVARGSWSASRLSAAADAASRKAVQRDLLRSAWWRKIEIGREGCDHVEDARDGSSRCPARVRYEGAIDRRLLVWWNARAALCDRSRKAHQHGKPIATGTHRSRSCAHAVSQGIRSGVPAPSEW